MITSSSNPKLKRAASLLKKSAHRRAEGVFVIEGPKVFMELLGQFPESIEEVFMTENASRKLNPLIAPLLGGINVELVDDRLFEKLSETVTPQGVLAIVRTPVHSIREMLDDSDSRLLILDGLRDPGNLGTIVRTAEAAGMSGILLSSDCVDITNPKVVRSTMGAVMRVPFLYTPDLAGEIKRLKAAYAGFSVYAAALNGSVLYTEPGYYGRTGVIIGNEANGISEEVLAVSDKRVRIPMAGRVESLNAAVAASLLMYEMIKSR